MTNTLTIDGNNIYDYFISGAKRLIHFEKSLNSINVFPVADGDTGTNLALTMKIVLLKSKKQKHLHETLNSISEVAVENAYGNSGMIFAQFLNGFTIEAQEKESITSEEFAEIAKKAAGHAYKAVGSPKEGTILSVMRDWANFLIDTVDSADFEKIFLNSIDKARTFVDKTKFKMKVLTKYNVVDAGAKAFLIFLEGIYDFLKKGEIPTDYSLDEIELETHENIFTDTQLIKNRYCSQFYIESDKGFGNLKSNLKSHGDSLVITGKDNHRKIHIHTDYPDKVMEYLAQESSVLSQKIEDMKIMNNVIHNRKNSIGLVTDSIADIPQEIIDSEQITVIPVNLICDSTLYLDKLTITPETFYKNMDDYKLNPTSAQPSSAYIERIFNMLLEHFNSLIGIFVSKKMSGTYNNAKNVAKKLADNGKPIAIIDSKLNSNAQGMLVTQAAKLIEDGLSHEDVVNKVKDLRDKISIYVSLKDLTPMIKGGRISKTAGFMLSKINLQPVVSINNNGKGIIYKKTLSQKSGVKKILEQIKKDKKEFGIKEYSVVYSDSKDDTQDFAEKLTSLIGFKPKYITPISPVIGLNSGKGAFAVSYVKGGD